MKVQTIALSIIAVAAGLWTIHFIDAEYDQYKRRHPIAPREISEPSSAAASTSTSGTAQSEDDGWRVANQDSPIDGIIYRAVSETKGNADGQILTTTVSCSPQTKKVSVMLGSSLNGMPYNQFKFKPFDAGMGVTWKNYEGRVKTAWGTTDAGFLVDSKGFNDEAELVTFGLVRDKVVKYLRDKNLLQEVPKHASKDFSEGSDAKEYVEKHGVIAWLKNALPIVVELKDTFGTVYFNVPSGNAIVNAVLDKCNVDVPQESTATMPSTPEDVPISVTAVVMGKDVGSDGRIASPTTTFAPHDTINALVQTDTSSPPQIFVVRWVDQSGHVGVEQQHTVTSVGRTTGLFNASSASGFSEGNYTLNVLVDGRTISTTPFTVSSAQVGQRGKEQENDGTQVLADTPITQAPDDDWKFTPNKNGMVMTSMRKNATIYLGRSCDANSPQYGKGKWEWANAGWSVTVGDKTFRFPRAEPPIESTDNDTGKCEARQ
jgi:hypothetical protein